MERRSLFSDGTNSIAHFGFGYISRAEPIIIALYMWYQLKDYKKDPNTLTDILEFLIGYGVANFENKNI
jgi:hypothetical protein